MGHLCSEFARRDLVEAGVRQVLEDAMVDCLQVGSVEAAAHRLQLQLDKPFECVIGFELLTLRCSQRVRGC